MAELSKIEFYNTPDGTVMYKIDDQAVKEMTSADESLIQGLLEGIRTKYSKDTFEALAEKYSKSERNRRFFEFNMVHRFCRCNFGEYDNNRYDIDENGVWHIEEVKCPLRGECKYEGRICKPIFNSQITEREKEVVKLIAGGLQTNEIANRLCISPSTVNRHRETIKTKLHLRGVADIASYYYKYLQNEH